MARLLNPEHHQQRRDQILRAAWHCFALYGIAGTRTSHLCQHAGMSPGHLFHYFPSKSAIIAAALVAEDARAPGAEGPPTRAWQDLQTWLQVQWHQLNDPVVARLTLEILAASAHDPVIAAAVQTHETTRHQRVVQWLQQAQGEGDVQLMAQPEQVAQWLLLLLDGSAGRAMVNAPWRDGAVLQQALAQLMQPALKWLS